MKAWHIILLILCIAGSFFVGYRTGITIVDNHTVKTDTVIIIDTVRDSVPMPSFEIEIGEVEIPFPIVIKENGESRTDTIRVPIPISQKEYNTENYRAWVSGYKASLDSIDVFPKTMYITKYKENRRWGLGVIGGYGIGVNGLSPYIGVGVYYRIW